MRTVEERLLGMKELSTVYARAGEGQRGSNEVTEDTVGTIQFEFVDWQQRRPASAIMDEIRDKTKDIPGVVIEVTKPKAGPPTGKPMTVQLASFDPDDLFPAARKAAERSARAARHPRRRRWPAAARHRLATRGRQGRGRQVRREPDDGRHGGPARHQRREGHGVPAERDRQAGRHAGALPRGPAQPRPDRRAARQHAGRRRCRSATSSRACRRRRSASSTASTGSASSPSRRTSPKACRAPRCSRGSPRRSRGPTSAPA